MALLWPNQEEVLGRLKNGSVLCAEPGAGKSRVALAYYFTKVCGGTLDFKMPDSFVPLYIITTARKRDTGDWGRECAPFLIPDEVVTVDSWNKVQQYQDIQNAFFIFDEQRVRGYGPWSKAFIKISRANKWIMLSATPGDVWLDYIPVFIANGFYKNKTEFITRHVVYDPYSKYRAVKYYLDEKTLLRNRNSILVDMPNERETIQNHETIPVEYDRDLYKMVARRRWDIYKDEPVQSASSLCLVLRRVVGSDPRRVSTVESLLMDHPKTIIFYNYDYELELLRELCFKMGRAFAEWNGHKHQEIPKEDKWVYLNQYIAGSEAWNCIETDTIIFYSDSYSYSQMVQAAGRIDRANTEFKDLYYYHLRSSAPIDRAVARALEKKKDFNEKGFARF